MRMIMISSLLCTMLAACGGDDDGVDSDEEARRAYLGLDLSIEKALDLGMKGFREADSANIPDQSGEGDDTGTMLVTGQVDQGESDNKGLRLDVALVEYSDGLVLIDEDDDGEDDLELDITYDTDEAAAPYLELSLRDIPDGTITGTLTGDYFMTGDIEGTVTLTLTMEGEIEGEGEDSVSRVVGSTHVTGTATNDDGGTYDVDLTI